MQNLQVPHVGAAVHDTGKRPYRPPTLEPHRTWNAITGVSLPIGTFLDDLTEVEE
jgi:hypothetical protein